MSVDDAEFEAARLRCIALIKAGIRSMRKPMPRMLFSLKYRDVRLAQTPEALHQASLGVLVHRMADGWGISRYGIRGALMAVCFGSQRQQFVEELPPTLEPQPWKAPMVATLRPNDDLSQTIPLHLLVGVGPEALEQWRIMAPTSPCMWFDLCYPTVDDATRFRSLMDGILDDDCTEETRYPDDPMGLLGLQPLVGFAPIEGIRPGTKRIQETAVAGWATPCP